MSTIAERVGPEKVTEYEPLLMTLDAVIEIARQDAPFMLPIVGPLCDIVAGLAIRVAVLEAAYDKPPDGSVS